jgi:hypothetical protein
LQDVTLYALQREIYQILDELGAPSELLAILGSWGDTLDGEETLSALQEHRRKGATSQIRQRNDLPIRQD